MTFIKILFKALLNLVELLPGIVLSLFAMAFSWLLAFFVNSNGDLPWILIWFETPDSNCAGGDAWKESNPTLSFYGLCQTWLARNPAYGYLKRCQDPTYGLSKYLTFLQWFTVPVVSGLTILGNKDIADGSQGVAGYYFMYSPEGWFQFWWIKDLGNGRCIQSSFGWVIKNYSTAPDSSVYGSLICSPLRTYDFTPKVA